MSDNSNKKSEDLNLEVKRVRVAVKSGIRAGKAAAAGWPRTWSGEIPWGNDPKIE